MTPLDTVTHSPRPNIVLILADDMGYSDIGCYGSEISTPNLDRLAGGGVVFSQMYNCARCCPTRASLMTGVYPHQAGIGHMVSNRGIPAYQGYLRDDCATIAESLQQVGYRTLMTGKWHAGGFWSRVDPETWRIGEHTHPLPVDRGFDEYYGLPGGGSYYNPSPLMHNHDIIEVPEGFYTTDNYTLEACRMMRASAAGDQPFFMHVCYNAPHWPLHAPREDIERYRGRYRKGWDETRTARHEELKGLGMLDRHWDISPRDENAPPWEDADHHDWEDSRMATYAAMVDRLDRGVGEIVKTLQELGILDNTLIIFLSDNGGSAEFLAENGRREQELTQTRDGREVKIGNIPGLEPGGPDTFMSYEVHWSNVSNSPFRLHKHWVHEGGISTPLIAHWLAGMTRPAGEIFHGSAHVIDISATILQVAGATTPEERNGKPVTAVEGESFLDVFAGQRWQRERPIFWEHEGNRAVRDGQWKLVSQWEKQTWELYDMNEDRTELHDLSQKNPGKVQEMSSMYDRWAQRVGVVPWGQMIGRK